MSPAVTRRRFMQTIGGVAASLAAGRRALHAADKPVRPNIILVMADDLGAGELGCYGNTTHRTPTLDQLARQGTQFQTCWATPICMPSRVEILTGKYGFRTGFYHNNLQPETREDRDLAHHATFSRLLQDAGYATAISGKWQLRGSRSPQRLGFDESFILERHDHYDGPSHVEGKPDYFPYNQPSYYWHPAITHNGVGVKTTPEQFGPDLCNEFVLDFARRHREQPFMVFHALYLPHWHWDYDFGDSTWPRVPEVDERGHPTGRKMPPSNQNCVEYIDRLMQRLIDGLRVQGQLENTIIMFTGDNGSLQHGKNRGDKECGVRVPMIVCGPTFDGMSRLNDQLIDFTDILPTMCDLAGAVTPPWDAIDGHSFAPRRRMTESIEREWVFSYLFDKRFLRDKRWLLDADGRFWDTHGRRDEQGYTDVTASQGPEVVAARRHFATILEELPAPPPDLVERALQSRKAHLPGRLPEGVLPPADE